MPEDDESSEYTPSVSVNAIRPARKTTYMHYGKTAADYCLAPTASAAESTATSTSETTPTPNSAALPSGRMSKAVASNAWRVAQEL